MKYDMILKIQPPSYLKLPDHWECVLGVIKKSYEDNHLLCICFIDKTLSIKEYNAKPVYYEVSFNIDWLWPNDVERIEWLAGVLSISVFDIIKKSQGDVKVRLRNSLFDIKCLFGWHVFQIVYNGLIIKQGGYYERTWF